MSKKIDREAAELLEEPFLKAPHELMRRNHRAAQRHVEKDFSFLQTTLRGLKQSLVSGSKPGGEEILAKLQAGSERVSGLKRKLAAIQPSSENPSPLKSRLSVIADLEALDEAGTDSPEWARWKQNRLDRYIVDYLLRTGKFQTAEVYAKSKGIEDQIDTSLHTECARIETALLEGHSCTEALSWCGENRGGLKKSGNPLEFSLRMQEYIELCRKRDKMGALAYVRKFLAQWKETHLGEIQKAMALLVFEEAVGGVPGYMAFYDKGRWETLRKEFRTTYQQTYSLPSQSLLSLSLFAGLASLKLSACCPTLPHATSTSTSEPPIPSLPAAPPIHIPSPADPIDPSLSALTDPTPLHNHPERPQRNLDCPSCAAEMQELVKEVPFSHHVNSTIVCRISGEVMDGENWPMSFPNGYVYSVKALEAMAAENHGMVTCPRTGEQCSFSRLLKVYIS